MSWPVPDRVATVVVGEVVGPSDPPVAVEVEDVGAEVPEDVVGLVGRGELPVEGEAIVT